MTLLRSIGLISAVVVMTAWAGWASAQSSQHQRTYVIVHGARSSIATFLQLESILEEQGHRVYLVSLTGLGDRAHLQNHGIRLETNIQDVVGLVEIRDLHDIYLVGHSYGGMVITGAWDRLRDRVHHVVYLDAFVPENGRSASDYSNRDYLAVAAANGGMVPSVRNPDGPTQSLFTFIDPIVLQNGPFPEETKRTYVRAIGNSERSADPTFAQFADKFRDDPRWNYFEIETGHGLQVQDPEGLSRILLGLE